MQRNPTRLSLNLKVLAIIKKNPKIPKIHTQLKIYIKSIKSWTDRNLFPIFTQKKIHSEKISDIFG
jgi:hypothetical protein